jgi:DNA-binding transcriptional LysR family regulator
LELEAKKLVILRVEHLPITRHWHIVKRKGKHLLPAAKQFQDFIIQEAKLYADDYDRFL